MRLPNVHEAVGFATLLAAARRINGVFTSSEFNVKNFQGRGRVLWSSSLGVGTTPVCTPLLQQRETDADNWESVPAAALPGGGFTTVTNAVGGGTQEVQVDLTQCKQRLRLQVTITGSAGQGFESCAFLEGMAAPRRPDVAI